MRDWPTYVRQHIALPDVDRATELEIIEDISSQLEDGYRDARTRGAGPVEADAEACGLVSDWDQLARDILNAKRSITRDHIVRPIKNSERALRKAGGFGEVMANVLRDARLALRRLRRAPVFGAVVVLTLGIGIGANTAIFSLVKGILLEPLPYDESERLVPVSSTAPGNGVEDLLQSAALHFTYKDEARLIEDIGLWRFDDVVVRDGAEPVELAAAMVTAGTLSTLRAQTILGRLFSVEDDTPGTPETVILSHAYWESQFASRSDIVGHAIEIEGRVREIIGVMPRGFRFLDADPEIYLPFRFDRAVLTVSQFNYYSIARLRDGVSLEAVTEDFARLLPVAVEKFPGGIPMEILEEAGMASVLTPLRDTIVGDVRDVLWVLLGTVGIVLLIACANVANLFVVRAEGREREVAVRSAIGASQRQIAGQYLVETVLLGLLGGIVGLGLARLGLRLLVTIAPAELPRLDVVSIDPGVLAFTLCASILSGIAFGLLPVIRSGRVDLVSVLKEGGRGGESGPGRHRTRHALAVGQIALALVLIVGAGLMVRSFQAIRGSNPDFQAPEDVIILDVAVPEREIEDPVEAAGRHEQIARGLAEMTGVTSVGFSSSITMEGTGGNDPIFVEDFPLADGQLPPIRRFKWIGEGYFEVMGNPVVAGCSLTWTDIHNRAPVVLVTENFTREYWNDPGEAVGRRVSTGLEPGDWREIIGVVGDVRDDGVTEPPVAVMYWPMLMEDFWGEQFFSPRTMSYAIRSPRVGTPDFLPELKKGNYIQ